MTQSVQETHLSKSFNGICLSPYSTFPMRAYVQSIHTSFQKDGANYDRQSIILTLEEGTIRDFFYSVWLPEEGQERELIIDVAYPVSMTARKVSFSRADSYYKRGPYLYVMDVDLKEELRKMIGKHISIAVLPGDTDIKDFS